MTTRRAVGRGHPRQTANFTDAPTNDKEIHPVPYIEVTNEAYELVTRYARLWKQTESEAIDTLIRLYLQPEHTAATPSHDGHASSDDSGQVQP